jgi:hypothetical protein
VRYRKYMRRRLAVLIVATLASGACSACGPETTSFRTTDRTDITRVGPPSAAYEVYLAGQLAAKTHVWSSGGFISSSDDTMTHIGFEISNTSPRPVVFDSHALELVAFNGKGETLPPPRLATITPLELPLVTIAPGETMMLAAYFQLAVRPRSVDSMELRWTVRAGSDEYHQITGFVRDDDAQIVERLPPADLRSPRS